MSLTERRRCSFELYPDGEGRPSHVYINLADEKGSLLEHKMIGRLFLGLRDNVSLQAADALVKSLNDKFAVFCVNHSSEADES